MIYHISERTNQDSILHRGLCRDNHAFICLCENVQNWISMFNDPVIFEIDIEKFMKDNPSVDIKTWQPNSDEICVWGDIPKEYVRLSESEVGRWTKRY